MGTVPLIPPICVQTPNYGRTGAYMPFEDMPSTAAAFKTWVDNFETLLGTYLEVISIGLPNDMGDPTSTLAKTTTINQAVIWAMPMTPNGTSGSGSLATCASGGYNTQIAATAAAFAALPGHGAAVGSKGEHWVRPGWEFDTTSGYAWCVLRSGNSNALFAQAFDQVTTTLKANGYAGKIMLNGNFDCRTVFSLLAHPENVDALAIDAYNNTNGSWGTNWDTIWANERKPRLDAIAAVCRANGKRFMFPEMGCEVGPAFHSAVPNTNYWKDMLGWMADNADIADVMAPFNQSIPSGAVTKTSEIAIAYCSPTGTVATSPTSLGSQHSTSTTAAWTWSTSPNKTAEIAEFQTYNIAGSFQKLDTPVIPASTVTVPASVPDYSAELDLFA